MRAGPLLAALVVLLLLAPPAGAEFGAYGDDGWPIASDGTSTNPYPGSPDPRLDPLAPFVPLNEVAGVTVYPYWPVLTAELQALVREHPDVARLHSIGKSTLGLDLWMLEIADFGRIDAGEGIPLEAREVVWVDGGTHSNEYSGVYFVTHLARFLTDEYGTNDTATWIVENRHTWLMPMVNPDGSNAFGRLNANLVNINRNYPVVWDGEGHDAFMDNRGPEPASEIETQLNIEWFERTRPDYYASVHCCANLWLYPYGEEGVDPVDGDMFARVCDEAFAPVRSDCGPIWSTIYPASGSSVDTAYEHTGAVAFGYEMSGRGAVAFWGQPFTNVAVREQEHESWNGLLHAFEHVHLYGAHPEVRFISATDDAIQLVLYNEGYGNLTGNLTFRLQIGATEQTHTFTLDENLTPAESRRFSLPAEPAAGTGHLEISYVKRVAAAPDGTLAFGLELVPQADGSLGVKTDPPTIGWFEPRPKEQTSGLPTIGVLLVVALVGLIYVEGRRHRDP